MAPVCPAPIPLHPVSPWAGAGPAGSGRSEPRAVVGRVGGSAVLGCGLLGAHEARPPLYVIEWVRFGFVLPIFIKFGLYSPRVDPEYAGEWRGRGGRRFWGHCGVSRVSTRCALGPTGCCCCWTTLIPLPRNWGALPGVSGCGRGQGGPCNR